MSNFIVIEKGTCIRCPSCDLQVASAKTDLFEWDVVGVVSHFNVLDPRLDVRTWKCPTCGTFVLGIPGQRYFTTEDYNKMAAKDRMIRPGYRTYGDKPAGDV